MILVNGTDLGSARPARRYGAERSECGADLLIEMGLQRQTLIERSSELEGRIRSIQEVVQCQYATSAASIDDGLS